MRSVGVKEFQDRATQIIEEGETFVIERRGVPLDFYVPVPAVDRQAGDEALKELGVLVDEILAFTGLSEEEVVRELLEGYASEAEPVGDATSC